MNYYTPFQIARLVRLSPQTVRAYLRRRYPHHERRSAWRLSDAEYESALGELRAAREKQPRQPLRALNQGQILVPFFE